MPTGAEMMLMSTLKTFMPKEVAEKIAGWASDGTFDRIGELRHYAGDVHELKKQNAYMAEALVGIIKQNKAILAELTALRELARQQRGSSDLRGDELQGRDAILTASSGRGLEPAALTECGTNGVGAHTGTSREFDGGYEGCLGEPG